MLMYSDIYVIRDKPNHIGKIISLSATEIKTLFEYFHFKKSSINEKSNHTMFIMSLTQFAQLSEYWVALPISETIVLITPAIVPNMGNMPSMTTSISPPIRARPAALKWEFDPVVGSHDPTFLTTKVNY